jgi:hypothetical protein
MPTEPKKLTDARAFLERFEIKMDLPEGLVYLSEALSLLDDLRADSESENVRKLASGLPLIYAKKVQELIEPLLLTSAPPMSHEMVNHWKSVFEEFKSFDFELPKDIEKTSMNVLTNYIKKDVIKFMSPTERYKFIEDLLNP